MSPLNTQVSAAEIRAYLDRLYQERLAAKLAGLGDCQTYMAELDDEIAHCHSAFVCVAVTEIAILRGELSGRSVG